MYVALVHDAFLISSFRAGGGVTRSASDIKDMLLHWCKSKTRDYKVSFAPNVYSYNIILHLCKIKTREYKASFALRVSCTINYLRTSFFHKLIFLVP